MKELIGLVIPLLPTMGYVAAVFALGWVFFVDPTAGKRRRPLQNFVFRLYLLLGIFEAMVRATDAGLQEFYKVRARFRVSPISERSFPPEVPPVPPALLPSPPEEERGRVISRLRGLLPNFVR